MFKPLDSCTASVAIVKATLAAAGSLGLCEDQLLVAAGLERRQLIDAHARLPLRCLIDLHRTVESQRGRAAALDLAGHLAQHQDSLVAYV
jgi:hypothetical protein